MKLGRKIIAVACAVMIAVSLSPLAACGDGNTTPDNTASTITDTKVYVIATDTSFAPFEFTDTDGQFVGIDMDLLAAIADDQDFEYTVNSIGFDSAMQAVTSDQADGIIAGMSITDERTEIFDFSDPYFDSGIVMGVSATNRDISGYSDLEGKVVAVKTDTEGEVFAESIKEDYGFSITSFKDSAMMYEDVVLGNSVACFEDYPVLTYAINEGVALKIIGEIEHGSSYGFAVAKGKNSELIEMFNAGLQNIKNNGIYQDILDTYIVDDTYRSTYSNSN